jgi:uncharacterized membrane protein
MTGYEAASYPANRVRWIANTWLGAAEGWEARVGEDRSDRTGARLEMRRLREAASR